MAEDTTLEIWSTKQSGVLNGADEDLTIEGLVDLPVSVKNKVDKIELPRNERIACLSALMIYDELLAPGYDNRFVDGVYCFTLREAPFSWHLGLNKPKGKANVAVADALPDRHQIGLEAGILPMGIMGITLTRDGKFLLGERDPKATHTIGNYCLAPAGFLGFDKPGAKNDKIISETFNREFFEEVLYGPDLFDKAPDEEDQRRINSLVNSYSVQGQLPADGLSPKIVGLTYEDKNNRGFGIPIIFKTSFTSAGLDEYLKMKKPDVEHKGYL